MTALRTFGMPLLAALISLSAIGLMTQARAAEEMPAQQDTHSEGTAPHNMGSSGWTGGTGGAHVGKNETTGLSQRSSDNSAADQPEMATGADLNGPPHRFPADDTPE
jgi:hypothetical protein